MSAVEETLKVKDQSKTKSAPMVNRALDFLSSVRFGVVLLCILVFLSMLGMIIIQQNVQGFDAWYATRTPAEKMVYGYLGLFDVYHSWYYNLLLLILSLNIVLASIDRFPSAWSYIAKPKLSATRAWLLNQQQHAVLEIRAASEEEAAQKLQRAFEENGLQARTSASETNVYETDETGRRDFSAMRKVKNLFVFGERGKWNRMGAYIVHVFLLTLFLGHFVALQTGFDADVRLTPDTNASVLRDFNLWQKTDEIQLIQINLDQQERYSVKLPFTITCTEIEQKLIDPSGPIEITNTLDWRTRIRIDDPAYGVTEADVSLNKPFTYRGYRFFQASAITVGSAKEMTLELKPTAEGAAPIALILKRNETATLPDGTKIEYENFVADFAMQGAEVTTRSAEYNNPAAVLRVTPPGGETQRVFAFYNKLPDNAPINAPKAGYRWRLASFEKSPLAHVLSIKYDPFNAAFVAWYIGGFGLMGALVFVFFVSHKRVWALIEDKGAGLYEIVLGGEANRNHQAFEDKFKNIVQSLSGKDSREQEV